MCLSISIGGNVPAVLKLSAAYLKDVPGGLYAGDKNLLDVRKLLEMRRYPSGVEVVFGEESGDFGALVGAAGLTNTGSIEFEPAYRRTGAPPSSGKWARNLAFVANERNRARGYAPYCPPAAFLLRRGLACKPFILAPASYILGILSLPGDFPIIIPASLASLGVSGGSAGGGKVRDREDVRAFRTLSRTSFGCGILELRSRKQPASFRRSGFVRHRRGIEQ
ncbi:hypothetical protein E4U50_004501 [Claviceps purpurea]|nr:hypothetical protein E4U50_004501 [Claviceps purpurea]